MMDEPSQQEFIVRYVLGELSEAEQQQVEEAYFTDPTFLQEVRAVRDELIDAFIYGELVGHERQRFEQRLQRTPALREKVEFARLLHHTVNPANAPLDHQPERILAVGQNRTAHREPGSRWQLWLPSLAGPRLVFTTATLAILLVGGLWLAGKLRRTPDQIRQERSEQASLQQHGTERAAGSQTTPRLETSSGVNQSPVPAAQTTPTIRQHRPLSSDPRSRLATFALSANLLRDPESHQELIVSRGVDTIQLQLELEQEDAQNFQAILQTRSGENIWAEKNLRPRLKSSRMILIVNLPARLFGNEDYVLKLRGEKSGVNQIETRYYFRVSKQTLR